MSAKGFNIYSDNIHRWHYEVCLPKHWMKWWVLVSRGLTEEEFSNVTIILNTPQKSHKSIWRVCKWKKWKLWIGQIHPVTWIQQNTFGYFKAEARAAKALQKQAAEKENHFWRMTEHFSISVKDWHLSSTLSSKIKADMKNIFKKLKMEIWEKKDVLTFSLTGFVLLELWLKQIKLY